MSDATTPPDPTRSAGSDAARDGPSRWKAGAAALLLLLAGAALGVTVDRLWVAGAGDARATPLTADALARSLELGPRERARLEALLDSLEAEVAAAAAAGPDSLRTVARRARGRLRRALPPGSRPAFRRWMQHHHRQMMQRMHPGGGPGMPGRNMRMRGDDSGRGMMMDHDRMGPCGRDGPARRPGGRR